MVCTAEEVNCVEEHIQKKIQVIISVHFSTARIDSCTRADTVAICECFVVPQDSFILFIMLY
jgi:hypothetical protein